MGIELRISLSLIMACVCTGSVFGNMLVFVSLVKERPLPNPAVEMIFRHLSLANLVLAGIGEPLVVVSLAAGKWVWGESMRFFEAFWVTTFGLFSMMILGLISFEQYSRFVKQQQLKTHQVAVLLSGIYFLAFFFGIAPLVGWCEYGPEGYGVSNSLMWNNLNDNNASYIICAMIVGYFFPLIIIMFCYRAIYRLVQAQLNTSVVKMTVSANVTSLSTNRNHIMLVQERQLASTITFVILSFFFAWTPYVFVNIINMFSTLVLKYRILATIPALFAKSSTLWWIIVYCLMDVRIKKACRKTCLRFKRSFRVWYFS
uniref:Opsin-1 n=1 Tax=Pleurobrachia bachei TaxID=34499 RepID=S4TMC8_PLEBA|nr:opsin-1 [Pleurobrachia bachei]